MGLALSSLSHSLWPSLIVSTQLNLRSITRHPTRKYVRSIRFQRIARGGDRSIFDAFAPHSRGVSSRSSESDSIGMENTDIDMVISIPDTPDRPLRREANKRPRSPEAPVRFQTGEHRLYYTNGRGRQAEHGHHRSLASGSNALFRRAAAVEEEKDKGKSICIDPVVNQRNALLTTALHTSNDGSCPNKGKGVVVEVECGGSVSNVETINLSSERKPIRGTRRLVRNGCISPHAIAARARQGVVDDTSSKDTEQELALAAASSIDIREIVSDNHSTRGRARGKGPEVPPSRVASRDEGWVSTRSHETDRRDESDTRGTCNVQDTRAVVDREPRPPQRRRKNGVTPSRFEPQVSVGEPSSSRPRRSYQRQGRQVLEIEDSSPDARLFRAPTRRVENDASDDVKARQIEADELMARELQEQLYEESRMRSEQMDETIARLMEQEEENSLRPSSSRASTRNTRSSSNTTVSHVVAADPGGSSRVEERPRQHSSRRRLQARAAVRAPRRVRARQQRHGAMNFNFPSGMGLDSRMDFLESLENVIGHSFSNSNLLHMDRDFTVDDYELLLALDENNHRHGGASTSRISNLPESTVQTDNFQETCVICLDTPTIGDTIRHLPCFHKFHKDCIDPWLGRSKACPVCKSSVT